MSTYLCEHVHIEYMVSRPMAFTLRKYAASISVHDPALSQSVSAQRPVSIRRARKEYGRRGSA